MWLGAIKLAVQAGSHIYKNKPVQYLWIPQENH